MGPAGQGTPRISDMKQGSGAAQRWRGQSSPTANSPAVTSSRHDLGDLANLLSHLAGLIADPRANGGGHGGVEVRVDGETPVWDTVVQINAWTSIYERWGT